MTVDEFIDVLIGNRRYVNCIYLYNKIDTISMEEVDRIARQPYSVVCSVEEELNLDGLKKAIWEVRSSQPSFPAFPSSLPATSQDTMTTDIQYLSPVFHLCLSATRPAAHIHETKRSSSRSNRANSSEERCDNRRRSQCYPSLYRFQVQICFSLW